MGTPQIDLTAGMVSKAPPAAAPPAQGGIDLSAGLVSHADAGTQPSNNPYPIAEGDKGAISQIVKTGDNILHLPAAIWHALTGDPQDATEKASVQALSSIPNITPQMALGMHRLIIAPMMKSAETADAYQKIADSKKSPAPATHPDSWIETIKDLLPELTLGIINPRGDGSDEQHMANVHRIASITPLLGSQAADVTEHYRQGDPSGAVGELLSTIFAGKALEGVTKGAAKQINKVAPKTAVVAGESSPVMAGQLKDAAPIAKTIASEPSPAIAEAQQTAAQQGVKNVASDAANRVLTKPLHGATGETIPGADESAPIEGAERRVDAALRKRVAEMTPEERAQALLTSEKTGLPNRRAFEEAAPANAVGMSDADGLKAVNDKFGYESGNALLKAKADALKEAGLDAFHDKGDEFLYRGESAEEIAGKMEKARDILRNKTISVEMNDGQVLQFKGADFSYGTGENLATAESGLKANKLQREALGQRARGELRGITEVGPQAGQEDLGGTSSPKTVAADSGASPNTPTAKPAPISAASFGDAADQVKAAAQPTFKKLDKLSDGEFSTFQNKLKMATAAERRASTMADMESAQKAQADARKGIDDLMTKHAAQFEPNELANAQSAWKDMQVLDKVHGYVEKAFSAPDDVAGASNMVSRDLSGSKLKTNLNQMLDKVPREDLTRVLGPDGVKNLYEIAELTTKPENLAKMQAQMTQLTQEGTLTKLVKSPMEARNLVARYLATSPRVSQMMMSALKFGTPAKVYGPLIANEIAKGEKEQKE